MFWKILALKFLGDFFADRAGADPVLHGQWPELHPGIFTIQAAFHLAVLLLEVPSATWPTSSAARKTLVFGAIFFPLDWRCTQRAELRRLRLRRGGAGRRRQHALGLRFGPAFRQPDQQGRGASTSASKGSARWSPAPAPPYRRSPAACWPRSSCACRSWSTSPAPCSCRRWRSPWRNPTRAAPLQEPAARYPAHLPSLPAAAPYPAGHPSPAASHRRPVDRAVGVLLLYQELGIGVGWFGLLFAVFQLAAPWAARARTRSAKRRGQDRLAPGLAQPGLLHPASACCRACGCCPWCRPTPCSGTSPTRCCSSG